jgi:hypothetical protein
VQLYTDIVDKKTLLKTGVRTNENEVNPNYPMLAWDGKGTRLVCIYWSEGKTKLFVYDAVARVKRFEQDLPEFEQIQDVKYGLDNNTLILSAVRKGQSDIYIFKIEQGTYEQITNDVYADLDPSLVSFPGKSGIIFSSNRPSATAVGGDTAIPSTRYNVFMVDNYNRSELRQITQLTNMKFADARYPMQYNVQHFTFISEESGIANRYAGFFTTQRAGLDTVMTIGDITLHNPDPKDLDSVLKAWGKKEPDSVYTMSMTRDSTYVFPITNYESSLQETKIAGDNGQVSEVRQEGTLKMLYKLKVDENALKRRNVNARPTDYRKKTITESQLSSGQAIQFKNAQDTSKKVPDFFETGFEKEKKDSAAAVTSNNNVISSTAKPEQEGESVLKKAKLFDYKLKFSVDNFSGGFNNDVLITRYQPYTGSLPIMLQDGGAFSGMIKASIFDLFEDIRFSGAIRLPLIGGVGTGAAVGGSGAGTSVFVPVNQSLFDGGGEWYGRVDYLKKRFDYSLLYYRRTDIGTVEGVDGTTRQFEGKSFTNLYQGIIKYPLDKVKSLRFSFGIRTDKVVIRGDQFDTVTLKAPDFNKQTYFVSHLEWVHDDAIMKATNIWNGLRYKLYVDMNTEINKPHPTASNLKAGRFDFNAGFDARYYYPIWRNFIWAVRAAGDFSWGSQKIVYYLGGVDGWLFPKYNSQPQPQDPEYAFQSLAVNLRGFNQNIANGNNALIINSEFRFPVFATLFNRPINNAFLRNFQIEQFVDLGTAWNGAYNGLKRPQAVYSYPANQIPPTVSVNIKAGGIGPFAGGYGFGVRSTLLGYFLRLDAGWEMNGFFQGKPLLQFAMGVDF